MLLGINADKEGRHIDDLLADTDVSLSDKDASMVNGLGESLLEDLCLQSAFHESLGGQLQDIIKGVLLVSQKTVSLKAADERGGLEESLGILEVQSQESTGSLTFVSKYI